MLPESFMMILEKHRHEAGHLHCGGSPCDRKSHHHKHHHGPHHHKGHHHGHHHWARHGHWHHGHDHAHGHGHGHHGHHGHGHWEKWYHNHHRGFPTCQNKEKKDHQEAQTYEKLAALNINDDFTP